MLVHARMPSCRTLSYTCVYQSTQRLRRRNMATHVRDQNKYPATNGFGPTGRARVLCQVPTTSRPGTNTGRGRSKSKHFRPRRLTTQSHTSQRPDHSDISLALAPRDHPLIPYVSLEAEGHGLLDRLLDIIHGDHSDGLLVTATLNTLGVLMHRRPIAANKILTSIFNFNPLKLANSPLTPKNKVIMKSIERTTRSLLMNIMKRYTITCASSRE